MSFEHRPLGSNWQVPDKPVSNSRHIVATKSRINEISREFKRIAMAVRTLNAELDNSELRRNDRERKLKHKARLQLRAQQIADEILKYQEDGRSLAAKEHKYKNTRNYYWEHNSNTDMAKLMSKAKR